MTPAQLKDFAYAMSNMDRATLERSGVMKPGQVGGSDWKRFNSDPMTFILKLPTDRLERLAIVITAALRERNDAFDAIIEELSN
jgi:hypothetical protein